MCRCHTQLISKSSACRIRHVLLPPPNAFFTRADRQGPGVFDFLFNPKGRISRKGYTIAFLAPYLVLTFIVAPLLGMPGVILIGLFFLWPKNVSVPVRRFHDMGITGKYQIGFLGLLFLARLIAYKGMVTALGGMEAMSAMTVEEQLAAVAEAARQGGNADMRIGTLLVIGVEISQMLLFGLVKGQKGKNQYGNDPLADGRGFAD
ncbi:DUF805 domain-containing protein [Parvularcula marina]|uniref:DUF805 domain-containing protein n=1 Tax=Parvularcula marina TaxID=2292771 RepID=A0A371RES6_9PROT|nr:DUF805 domain-containing protein [Parvularcula marina]